MNMAVLFVRPRFLPSINWLNFQSTHLIFVTRWQSFWCLWFLTGGSTSVKFVFISCRINTLIENIEQMANVLHMTTCKLLVMHSTMRRRNDIFIFCRNSKKRNICIQDCNLSKWLIIFGLHCFRHISKCHWTCKWTHDSYLFDDEWWCWRYRSYELGLDWISGLVKKRFRMFGVIHKVKPHMKATN